jgi:endonuclease/exonuclease/phosphatase (EEP) superfamily protein YafD
VTGSLGADIWLLDLSSHFPLQYLAVQLMGMALLLKFKPRAYLALGFALVILISLNTAKVYAYYWPQTQAAQAKSSASKLKILQLNVLWSNQNYSSVDKLLMTTHADIVSLQEVTPTWYKALEHLKGLKRFPYKLKELNSKNVLLSKIPLKSSKIITVSAIEPQNSIFYTEIPLGGKTVSITTLHPFITLSSYDENRYIQHFQELDRLPYRPYRVLIGDLNTTPWSMHYSRFLKQMDLKDARAHQGFYPTWNAFKPFFYIPIDHVLVSDQFQPLYQKVGPFIGSDHLPVYMELALAK